MAWLDGRHTLRGLWVTTGIAQRSARWPSTGTASAGKRGGNDQRALGTPRSNRRVWRSLSDRDAPPPPAAAAWPARSARRAARQAARAAAADRPARADAPSPLPPRAPPCRRSGQAAQFVIPFHQLAHHAGLVEHFLRPMDRPRARAERALLGDRRAAGGEDQRHAVARQVDEIIDGVGGADIGVHHHRLRLAVHQVGAVRHGDREIFVRHQDRLRNLGVGLLGAAKASTIGGKSVPGLQKK